MSEMTRPSFWDCFFAEHWLETVTVHVVDDLPADGKLAVREKRELRALVQEQPAVSLKEFGATAAGLTFLLPADGFRPKIGDRVEYRGKLYDLKSIQVCKTVHGRPVAYRCRTV